MMTPSPSPCSRYGLRRHARPFSVERLALSDAGLVPRYVRLGRSKLVSGGRGLFATRSLPANAAITGYPGPRVPKRGVKTRLQRSRSRDFWWYVYAPRGVDYYLQPSPEDLSSGIAHMANDAIHPEVTGRQNNCEFRETEAGLVYLQTSRPVRAGEELLVDYTLPYWIDRARCATAPPLPPMLQRMLERISCVQGLVRAFDAGVRDYVGMDVVRIKDKNARMLCQCPQSIYKSVLVAPDTTLSCPVCKTDMRFL